MANTLHKKLYCLVFFLILVVPISVSAQNHLEYIPDQWNFGKVEIGSSATGIFTLTNTDGANVLVSEIWWYEPSGCRWEDNCGPFVLTNGSIPLNPPIVIPIGESYDVPVVFSPSSPGQYFAILEIETDAANAFNLFFEISGEGILEEIPPSEIMAELIDQFTSWVDDGTVSGSGPGSSASGRLKAFENMLKSSSDLISASEYGSACVQLQDALSRIDGNEPPPDFVTATTDELAGMIENVIIELGCP